MRFVTISLALAASAVAAFAPNSVPRVETQLQGLFDNWGAGGSGKDRLDEVRNLH